MFAGFTEDMAERYFGTAVTYHEGDNLVLGSRRT